MAESGDRRPAGVGHLVVKHAEGFAEATAIQVESSTVCSLCIAIADVLDLTTGYDSPVPERRRSLNTGGVLHINRCVPSQQGDIFKLSVAADAKLHPVLPWQAASGRPRWL